MHEKEIERLQQFIKAADEVSSGRFSRVLSTKGQQIVVAKNPDGSDGAKRFGPDDEAIRAMVLTLRRFLQKNDDVSMERMVKMYAGLKVPQKLKDDFQGNYNLFLRLMKEPPPMQMQLDGVVASRWDIFEIVVYGRLAHETQRARFKKWEENPIRYAFFEDQFVDVAKEVIKFVSAQATLCRGALGALRGS